jgi:chromate transport protein ChrA
MAIGDLAKEIQKFSDSKLRERLREVEPMSPSWTGIIAELEWRASQKMYRQTRALVWLTWVIAFLSFALLVYTVVAALILSPIAGRYAFFQSLHYSSASQSSS